MTMLAGYCCAEQCMYIQRLWIAVTSRPVQCAWALIVLFLSGLICSPVFSDWKSVVFAFTLHLFVLCFIKVKICVKVKLFVPLICVCAILPGKAVYWFFVPNGLPDLFFCAKNASPGWCILFHWLYTGWISVFVFQNRIFCICSLGI